MHDIELKAHFIHGLSNKVRLMILELLKSKEMTVNEIVKQSQIVNLVFLNIYLVSKGVVWLILDKKVNTFITK